MIKLKVSALSPLLFRDAKPFSNADDETRAESRPMPPPSTIAGLARTTIGQILDWDWQTDGPQKAMSTKVHGLLNRNGVVFLPAPLTSFVQQSETGPVVTRQRPWRTAPADSGTTLPDNLAPLTVGTKRPGKPIPGPHYFSWDDTMQWLAHTEDMPIPWPAPPTDTRVRNAIDSKTRTTIDGQLFTVVYRAWEIWDGQEATRFDLDIYVETTDAIPDQITTGRFGGENRPVAIEVTNNANLPGPPPDLIAALTDSPYVTMQLVTPAVFTDGWKPGWLSGPEPRFASLAGAKLVAAAVDRPEGISGWDYQRRAPKATRWAAPAGSTYFFELPKPFTKDDISAMWLNSVSDEKQDQLDGFGLAIWGVWKQ